MDNFEDVVLPGFDQPEPKQPRVLTRKEQHDKETQVKYTHVRGVRRFLCEPCVSEYDKGYRKDIRDATHTRTSKSGTTYMCYFHKHDMETAEQLGNLNKKGKS